MILGFTHLDHVIRCDNDSTTYHVDQFSNRKSVVTLLCKPEHGLDSTRLSYRFVCKTSCLGGMERRPIIVIFTLEDYKLVLLLNFSLNNLEIFMAKFIIYFSFTADKYLAVVYFQ